MLERGVACANEARVGTPPWARPKEKPENGKGAKTGDGEHQTEPWASAAGVVPHKVPTPPQGERLLVVQSPMGLKCGMA